MAEYKSDDSENGIYPFKSSKSRALLVGGGIQIFKCPVL
jgi:hypothetical protein